MANQYATFIKTLRKERGFSQLDISERLGISRASYIAVEQGKRNLDLPEAEKLSGIFGISVAELLCSSVPKTEKYKQMILAYLRGGISRDGQVPKTKLAKLLYLADFAWYYDNLKSMSGMQYRRLQYGPVPDMYFRAVDELESEGKILINRKDESILISESQESKREKLNELEKDELNLIGEIAEKWRDKKTQEIVSFTHNQLPYKICLPDEIIPYELITQEDPDHVY
jgi:transcriptional regulator with XRE-family HTH domain